MMTVAEVAQQLRVNAETVRRLIGRGEIRATRIGRCVRITPAAVEEYIARVTDPPKVAAQPRPRATTPIAYRFV